MSPFFGPACRFYPSCSEYAHQAISEFGLHQGAVLAAKRLFRCHPFGDGGFDPVPDRTRKAELHALFIREKDIDTA